MRKMYVFAYYVYIYMLHKCEYYTCIINIVLNIYFIMHTHTLMLTMKCNATRYKPHIHRNHGDNHLAHYYSSFTIEN